MSASKSKIRILVADDHPVVRRGLQMCLARCPRYLMVGEATNGSEAIERIRELKPDVALMDINMPELNGLGVTEVIRKDLPNVRIVILSAHHTRDLVLRVIQAGAHGFVSKDAPPDDLSTAIEAVCRGETYFSPEIAKAALSQLVNNGGRREPLAELTSREREVLVLIAEGQSNKEIASTLGIGVRTIETHRERIMRRLRIRSVAGLTRYAIANGLVELEEALI